ncbi:MAG: prepilin-type N-terminal cleavage/methylation domain-containing protein [Acidimicrobiales bacterium]
MATRRPWPRHVRGARDDEGFGLIEVLVSMALLAVVLVAVGAGMLYALRAATASRERSVATGLLGAAEATLQAMRYTTPGTPPPAPSPSETTLGGVTYTTTAAETMVTSGPEVNLLDLTVVVSWPGATGGTQSVTGELQVAPQ